MDTVGRIVNLGGAGSREPSPSVPGIAQVMPLSEFRAVQTACENFRAENERLRKRLAQCEASLSTWDDNFDSRYWTTYPDAKAAIDAADTIPQQSLNQK